jgi:hypothetical protein
MVCRASTTYGMLRRMKSMGVAAAAGGWVSCESWFEGRKKKEMGRLVLEIWLMYEEVRMDASEGMDGTKKVMEKWG